MGFSLTGAHVIFFVAAIIVAGAVSGVFIGVTMNISNSLADQGKRLQDQLDTDFTIINDPQRIPLSGDGNYRIFYLKNIGGKELITNNQTMHIFIDGEIVPQRYYNFSDASIHQSEYTNLYIVQTLLSAGNHVLRIVGPQAVEDDFIFTI
ncbi:MAG: hypothetical protein QXL17_03645 [Candidatus Thermoplasmatota archaeon]